MFRPCKSDNPFCPFGNGLSIKYTIITALSDKIQTNQYILFIGKKMSSLFLNAEKVQFFLYKRTFMSLLRYRYDKSVVLQQVKS